MDMMVGKSEKRQVFMGLSSQKISKLSLTKYWGEGLGSFGQAGLAILQRQGACFKLSKTGKSFTIHGEHFKSATVWIVPYSTEHAQCKSQMHRTA
jgi:hypothetical protein